MLIWHFTKFWSIHNLEVGEISARLARKKNCNKKRRKRIKMRLIFQILKYVLSGDVQKDRRAGNSKSSEPANGYSAFVMDLIPDISLTGYP